MENEFYFELTVAATGMDCPAALAWLTATLNGDPQYAAASRAAAHWAKADDKLRDALASYLGISEPLPRKERCPVPRAIAADYEFAFETACALLAE
jgi:hypothetical protein